MAQRYADLVEKEIAEKLDLPHAISLPYLIMYEWGGYLVRLPLPGKTTFDGKAADETGDIVATGVTLGAALDKACFEYEQKACAMSSADASEKGKEEDRPGILH